MIDEVKIRSCNGVYEPREDSYLLADAVERYAHGNVLDMGTGTGIQGITAAKKGCNVTFVDIDENALECARNNAVLNNVGGKFAKSDMFGNVNGRFDTIIFNPPYVPSSHVKYVALDGGKGGREVIDRFINSYANHRSEDGKVLLLESSLNGYEEDIRRLGAEVISKGHYFFEDLLVLLF